MVHSGLEEVHCFFSLMVTQFNFVSYLESS